MTDVGVKTEILKGSSFICLYFKYSPTLVHKLKQMHGCWHAGLRCWVVADTVINKGGLRKLFDESSGYQLYKIRERKKTEKSIRVIHNRLPGLEDIDRELVDRFRHWMTFRRYSKSTVRTYVEMVVVFLRFIKPLKATDPLGDGIQRFTDEYILPNQLSYSYQNQLVNALKLFYREMLRQEVVKEQLQRPRATHRLPNVLNKNEIRRILGVMKNVKHRAMLSTIYGCGLRRGELLNLKPMDIDSERGVLVVRSGKGNKDRIVPISVKNIELLKEYYRLYRPKYWLFEGMIKGERYDERSLQQVLKRAIMLSGIKKPVTLHWLRHSYATHLHESGVDIRYIQEILGHRSTRTTEIYTHVSARSIQLIRSPLDDL